MALPTIKEMFGRTLPQLDKAHYGLSEARDWMKSDWRTQPTKRQAQARLRALDLIGQAKALIDEAKNTIYEAGD